LEVKKIMSKVNVRYIVSDVDAAIPFYTELLGFKLEMHPAPGFASLSRGDLQLLLNRPGASRLWITRFYRGSRTVSGL
jgi:catechol 2,3-dioxygenase-like lactoylglutathione lyase family enzyme